mmetsp:Transcript_8438/g.13998  ORF Transcript_8438/g.13998 Transcript_8438/m.13998 type:complete len:330 (+) Transcript_8438:23-1012(+)|eukprot:CAMPEP_0174986894 /NCGR_PEP_ID=MMETSP0004_2-20121128/19223_1 /TAXON_ID=420556 /ORGANISM="Ochromonas sp., Strain CCMP1393" /LENGTH=329 /DNA_ID=CAMNT_0016239849 /DNA_START=18 /DNA_END=1007 /DNA_ORIENTATION=+
MDKKTVALGAVAVGAAAGVAYAAYSYLNNGEMSTEEVNAAFVFIKPHANNTKTQQLVASTLASKGIKIVSEGEFTGEQIDAGMHIDQHYYAIASKATLLKPADIPVPADKFEEKFGLSWETALADGKVFNAMEACTFLGVDADGLDKLWNTADKVKFGGGFYCGSIEVEGKPKIYTFNAFFMSMRGKFVAPGTSIHYYVVEFSPKDLSWEDFRGKVLGPTDPKQAPEGALRGLMLKDWEALGLAYEPNTGDNCVHASASPFEGLAERMNWLKVDPANDVFGAKCLAAGIPEATLKEWSVDPRVKGKSIFDQLEDQDCDTCLATMVEAAK